MLKRLAEIVMPAGIALLERCRLCAGKATRLDRTMKKHQLRRVHTLDYLRFYITNSETNGHSLSFATDSCTVWIYRWPGMLKIVLEIYASFVHAVPPPTFDDGFHALQSIHLKSRSWVRDSFFSGTASQVDKGCFTSVRHSGYFGPWFAGIGLSSWSWPWPFSVERLREET